MPRRRRPLDLSPTCKEQALANSTIAPSDNSHLVDQCRQYISSRHSGTSPTPGLSPHGRPPQVHCRSPSRAHSGSRLPSPRTPITPESLAEYTGADRVCKVANTLSTCRDPVRIVLAAAGLHNTMALLRQQQHRTGAFATSPPPVVAPGPRAAPVAIPLSSPSDDGSSSCSQGSPPADAEVEVVVSNLRTSGGSSGSSMPPKSTAATSSAGWGKPPSPKLASRNPGAVNFFRSRSPAVRPLLLPSLSPTRGSSCSSATDSDPGSPVLSPPLKRQLLAPPPPGFGSSGASIEKHRPASGSSGSSCATTKSGSPQGKRVLAQQLPNSPPRSSLPSPQQPSPLSLQPASRTAAAGGSADATAATAASQSLGSDHFLFEILRHNILHLMWESVENQVEVPMRIRDPAKRRAMSSALLPILRSTFAPYMPPERPAPPKSPAASVVPSCLVHATKVCNMYASDLDRLLSQLRAALKHEGGGADVDEGELLRSEQLRKAWGALVSGVAARLPAQLPAAQQRSLLRAAPALQRMRQDASDLHDEKACMVLEGAMELLQHLKLDDDVAGS